jgi:hypothetical protein
MTTPIQKKKITKVPIPPLPSPHSLVTGDTTMDLDTSGYSTSKGYVDTSYLRASKKGVYESDDDEMSLGDQEEEGEEEEGSEGGVGVRRSRRKTKGKRLQFWKNERGVYMKGKMMGLLIANETPAKPKRKQSSKKKTSGGGGGGESKKRRKTEGGDLVVKKLDLESESEREEIPPEIPKQFKYLDR